MNKETPNLTIPMRRDDILKRIDASAKAPVTLVAVSKVQTDERIAQMLDTGQSVYGENRVQDAQGRWGERFSQRREGLTLHLIGPLQTNKAELAVALFDVIETLDREKLARHIASASQKIGKMPRLFVQVNTGAEPQKAGILPANLERFLKTIRTEYDLNPEGLMCIPPIDEAPSGHFILLRELARRNGLKALSMGMSADYEVAVKLGASHVRVGTALFGARNYA